MLWWTCLLRVENINSCSCSSSWTFVVEMKNCFHKIHDHCCQSDSSKIKMIAMLPDENYKFEFKNDFECSLFCWLINKNSSKNVFQISFGFLPGSFWIILSAAESHNKFLPLYKTTFQIKHQLALTKILLSKLTTTSCCHQQTSETQLHSGNKNSKWLVTIRIKFRTSVIVLWNCTLKNENDAVLQSNVWRFQRKFTIW